MIIVFIYGIFEYGYGLYLSKVYILNVVEVINNILNVIIVVIIFEWMVCGIVIIFNIIIFYIIIGIFVGGNKINSILRFKVFVWCWVLCFFF